MSEQVLSLEEIQKIELETLKTFHKFCKENNLKYYLGGGTMLGAIRHKGFIPWDDDVDLMMPRPDYMKLLQLTKNKTIEEHYKVESYYHDKDTPRILSAFRFYDTRTKMVYKNWRIPYISGCGIDVMAIDGLSNSSWKRKLQFSEARFVLDLYNCCLTKIGGKRRSKLVGILQYSIVPFIPIIRLFGIKKYQKWLKKISMRYSYDKSEYVGVLVGRASEKEAMKKVNLEPAIEVEFEGEHFYSIANYHEYLTNLYGDYMTLPPENERLTRHETDVLWK